MFNLAFVLICLLFATSPATGTDAPQAASQAAAAMPQSEEEVAETIDANAEAMAAENGEIDWDEENRQVDEDINEYITQRTRSKDFSYGMTHKDFFAPLLSHCFDHLAQGAPDAAHSYNVAFKIATIFAPIKSIPGVKEATVDSSDDIAAMREIIALNPITGSETDILFTTEYKADIDAIEKARINKRINGYVARAAASGHDSLDVTYEQFFEPFLDECLQPQVNEQGSAIIDDEGVVVVQDYNTACKVAYLVMADAFSTKKLSISNKTIEQLHAEIETLSPAANAEGAGLLDAYVKLRNDLPRAVGRVKAYIEDALSRPGLGLGMTYEEFFASLLHDCLLTETEDPACAAVISALFVPDEGYNQVQERLIQSTADIEALLPPLEGDISIAKLHRTLYLVSFSDVYEKRISALVSLEKFILKNDAPLEKWKAIALLDDEFKKNYRHGSLTHLKLLSSLCSRIEPMAGDSVLHLRSIAYDGKAPLLPNYNVPARNMKEEAAAVYDHIKDRDALRQEIAHVDAVIEGNICDTLDRMPGQLTLPKLYARLLIRFNEEDSDNTTFKRTRDHYRPETILLAQAFDGSMQESASLEEKVVTPHEALEAYREFRRTQPAPTIGEVFLYSKENFGRFRMQKGYVAEKMRPTIDEDLKPINTFEALVEKARSLLAPPKRTKATTSNMSAASPEQEAPSSAAAGALAPALAGPIVPPAIAAPLKEDMRPPVDSRTSAQQEPTATNAAGGERDAIADTISKYITEEIHTVTAGKTTFEEFFAPLLVDALYGARTRPNKQERDLHQKVAAAVSSIFVPAGNAEMATARRHTLVNGSTELLTILNTGLDEALAADNIIFDGNYLDRITTFASAKRVDERIKTYIIERTSAERFISGRSYEEFFAPLLNEALSVATTSKNPFVSILNRNVAAKVSALFAPVDDTPENEILRNKRVDSREDIARLNEMVDSLSIKDMSLPTAGFPEDYRERIGKVAINEQENDALKQTIVNALAPQNFVQGTPYELLFADTIVRCAAHAQDRLHGRSRGTQEGLSSSELTARCTSLLQERVHARVLQRIVTFFVPIEDEEGRGKTTINTLEDMQKLHDIVAETAHDQPAVITPNSAFNKYLVRMQTLDGLKRLIGLKGLVLPCTRSEALDAIDRAFTEKYAAAKKRLTDGDAELLHVLHLLREKVAYNTTAPAIVVYDAITWPAYTSSFTNLDEECLSFDQTQISCREKIKKALSTIDEKIEKLIAQAFRDKSSHKSMHEVYADVLLTLNASNMQAADQARYPRDLMPSDALYSKVRGDSTGYGGYHCERVAYYQPASIKLARMLQDIAMSTPEMVAEEEAMAQYLALKDSYPITEEDVMAHANGSYRCRTQFERTRGGSGLTPLEAYNSAIMLAKDIKAGRALSRKQDPLPALPQVISAAPEAPARIPAPPAPDALAPAPAKDAALKNAAPLNPVAPSVVVAIGSDTRRPSVLQTINSTPAAPAHLPAPLAAVAPAPAPAKKDTAPKRDAAPLNPVALSTALPRASTPPLPTLSPAQAEPAPLEDRSARAASPLMEAPSPLITALPEPQIAPAPAPIPALPPVITKTPVAEPAKKSILPFAGFSGTALGSATALLHLMRKEQALTAYLGTFADKKGETLASKLARRQDITEALSSFDISTSQESAVRNAIEQLQKIRAIRKGMALPLIVGLVGAVITGKSYFKEGY